LEAEAVHSQSAGLLVEHLWYVVESEPSLGVLRSDSTLTVVEFVCSSLSKSFLSFLGISLPHVFVLELLHPYPHVMHVICLFL